MGLIVYRLTTNSTVSIKGVFQSQVEGEMITMTTMVPGQA